MKKYGYAIKYGSAIILIFMIPGILGCGHNRNTKVESEETITQTAADETQTDVADSKELVTIAELYLDIYEI